MRKTLACLMVALTALTTSCASLPTNSAPHVTYVEIPETGHMLPVEAPDQLASAISDWLSSLES